MVRKIIHFLTVSEMIDIYNNGKKLGLKTENLIIDLYEMISNGRINKKDDNEKKQKRFSKS